MPAVVILALLLAGCGCGIDGLDFGNDVTLTQERTLELPIMGVEKVSVTTTNGTVKFASTNDPSEAIKVEVSIRSSGDDQLEAQMVADSVEILTPMEGENGTTQAIRWDWRGGARPHGSVGVSFEVTLPEHLAVAAKSTNGTLEVEGTHADCDLNTTNGRISVAGVVGPCRVETTNGRVRVEADLPSCEATSTNGSIDIHGGTERLSAKTTNGRIEVSTYAKELQLETQNAHLEAELFSQSGLTGSVKSHNGSIELRMADDANVQLVCNTENGRIDYDDLGHDALITITKGGGYKRGEKLTATLGQGGQPLVVETHNASISLKQGLDEDDWELAPPAAKEDVGEKSSVAPRWVVVDGTRIEIDSDGVVLENGATVRLAENGDVIISRPDPVAEKGTAEAPPKPVPPKEAVAPSEPSEPSEPAAAAEPEEPKTPVAPVAPEEPQSAVEEAPAADADVIEEPAADDQSEPTEPEKQPVDSDDE